ncbi:MAG: hypothetical protein ACHQHN_06585 [Sphingobacteriales bacterium]
MDYWLKSIFHKKCPNDIKNAFFSELSALEKRKSIHIKTRKMKFIETLITPILKAVGAVANNGMGIFKKRKKAPFNPKISLGGVNF